MAKEGLGGGSKKIILGEMSDDALKNLKDKIDSKTAENKDEFKDKSAQKKAYKKKADALGVDPKTLPANSPAAAAEPVVNKAEPKKAQVKKPRIVKSSALKTTPAAQTSSSNVATSLEENLGQARRDDAETVESHGFPETFTWPTGDGKIHQWKNIKDTKSGSIYKLLDDPDQEEVIITRKEDFEVLRQIMKDKYGTGEKPKLPPTFTWPTSDKKIHKWIKMEDLKGGKAIYHLEGSDMSDPDSNIVVAEEEGFEKLRNAAEKKYNVEGKLNFPDTFTWPTSDGIRHTWIKTKDNADGSSEYSIEHVTMTVRTEEDFQKMRELVTQKYGGEAIPTHKLTDEEKKNLDTEYQEGLKKIAEEMTKASTEENWQRLNQLNSEKTKLTAKYNAVVAGTEPFPTDGLVGKTNETKKKPTGPIEKEFTPGDYAKVLALVKDTIDGKDTNSLDNQQLLVNYPNLFNKYLSIEDRRKKELAENRIISATDPKYKDFMIKKHEEINTKYDGLLNKVKAPEAKTVPTFTVGFTFRDKFGEEYKIKKIYDDGQVVAEAGMGGTLGTTIEALEQAFERGDYTLIDTATKDKKIKTAEELIQGIKQTESADGKWVVFSYIHPDGTPETYRVAKEKAAAEYASIVEKMKALAPAEKQEEKIPAGELRAEKEAIQSIKDKIASKEKVTLSATAETNINNVLGKLGLGPENMKQIPGWDVMTEGQRLLVLHRYQNFYVENIKANAEVEYEKRFTKANIFKKMAMRFGRTSRTRKIERELLGQATSGGMNETKRAQLTDLTEQTIAYDFNVVPTADGKIFVDFANKPTNAESLTSGQKEIFQNYNIATMALMAMPEEWGSKSATRAQRAKFEAAKELQQIQETELLKVKKELYGEEAAIKEMNMTRAQVELVRFDLANPTIGKAVDDIRSTSIKDIFNRRDVFYGGLFFLGAGLRKLGVTAPIVGGAMGGFRGWLKGKEKLKKQDIMSRRGELTKMAEAKSIFKGTTKDTTIQSIESLTSKINGLVNRIAQANEAGDYKKAQDLTRMLDNRIQYTQTKMDEARVNHGNEATRLQNRFELVNALTKGRGQVSVYETPEESRKMMALVAERVIGYEALQDKRISRRRAIYLTEKVVRGAILGATVAEAGKLASDYLFGNHPTGHKIGGGGEEQQGGGGDTGDRIGGGGDGGFTPKPGDSLPPVKSPSINEWALAHKGDSPESLFIRQIEHRPDIAKALGYTGDMSDTSALHKFAGIEAHKLAMNEGYFANIHNQVGINGVGIDKAAYQLEISDGKVNVHEYFDGKDIEVHNEGTTFETDREQYEYLRDKKVSTGGVVRGTPTASVKPPDYTTAGLGKTGPGAGETATLGKVDAGETARLGTVGNGNEAADKIKNAMGGSQDTINSYAIAEGRLDQKPYKPAMPVIYPAGIPRGMSILEQIFGIFGGR